jgi:hypothetical protein
MELHVRRVVQSASGGDHVTIFDAEVEIGTDSIHVEILNVVPMDAQPGEVEAVREAIRRGAEQVLKPLGKGATIRVQSVVVHPVDCNPRKFEQYTAEELSRLLVEQHVQSIAPSANS